MAEAMVVEDDPQVRNVVASVLRDEGYDVHEAVNGRDALERVRARIPDVLLLDLMMPVMDGWQFLEECSGVPGCERLPIVVFSASHNAPTDPRVRAFIEKPFDIDAMATVVRTIAPP